MDLLYSRAVIWRWAEYLNNPKNQTKPLYAHQFELYLDSNYIVRCKGRINNSPLSINEKNPIFLPSKHSFIRLLVMSTHYWVMHGRTNVTLTAVYEKYWILKGRQVVKSIIRSCIICKKLEGPAYSAQPSPDLPDFWVSDDPPFAHTGINFAGPLYIRIGRSAVNTSKVYVCLLPVPLPVQFTLNWLAHWMWTVFCWLLDNLLAGLSYQ